MLLGVICDTPQGRHQRTATMYGKIEFVECRGPPYLLKIQC